MHIRNRATLTLAVIVISSFQLAAQDNSPHHARHHQYKLYDVGTFGGPGADTFTAPNGYENIYINNQGAIVGTANTSGTDPFSPNCFYECYVSHALTYHNGHLTDLGTLPGEGNSSVAMGIAPNGLIVGVSETGALDPLTGFPAYHAIFWRDGQMADLGTFGGALSQAWAVNSAGQAAGVASNTILDMYATGLGPCVVLICPSGAPWTVATQQRAFLWQHGVKRDLGTLGGNDAAAYLINEAGQIAGVSYTNDIPSPTTGVPTQDPFFWDRGTIFDIGSFGGTQGFASSLNNRGQVVGYLNLPGDQFLNAFLWQHGVLTDLGTFGGDDSNALWIDDAGDITGIAAEPGDSHFPAALWTHGVMINMGTLPGDDAAFGQVVNSARQVVGTSFAFGQNNTRGFLWENGDMADLTALVEPPFDGVVYNPFGLNERGDIVAIITLPTLPNNFRLVILVPDGDCDGSCEQRLSESRSLSTRRSPPKQLVAGSSYWLLNGSRVRSGMASFRSPLN